MTDQHISRAPIQSPEQRREIASRNLAKYMCVIAGIEPVDSTDGSSNWWMFSKEAEEIYDGLVKRFPPLPQSPAAGQASLTGHQELDPNPD